MSKFDLSLAECNIISQGLRLKRESVLRSRNKEITGSQLHTIYNQQLTDLTAVEIKMFALVDGGLVK